MATTKFVNRARMLTSTTGTGTSVALTTAVDGYFTLAEAGLQDGDVVDYIIEQGADFEIQHDQTYSSSGPSLSRGTPAASKVGGTAGTSKINLLGSAQVAIVGLAKSFDINTFTAKATPATNDILWGHSVADGARRRIPISGILDLVPTPGLVFLNGGVASAASTVDIGLPSGYEGYRLFLKEAYGSTSGAKCNLRTSSNGGSTFDSGASDYTWLENPVFFNPNASSAVGGKDNDALIQLHGEFPNSAALSVDMIIDIIGANLSTSNKKIFVRQISGDGGGAVAHGLRKSTSAINAIRIFLSTGTISCRWLLYGYT